MSKRRSAFAFLAALAGCQPTDNALPYTCADCSIALDSVVTLDAIPDADPTSASEMVRLRQGKYLVAKLSEPSQIAVFDNDGRYLQSIGKPGDGPGEFREIDDIGSTSLDSIYVLHDGRITVLGPELQYARSIKLDGYKPGILAVRSDGSFVTGSRSDAPGFRVKSYTAAGTLMWGSDDGEPDRYRFVGALAVSADTSWVAYTSPDLQRLGSNGVGRSIWSSTPLWAESHSLATEHGRRAPSINDIAIGNDTVLWIASYYYGDYPVAPPQQNGRENAVMKLGVSDWRLYAKSFVEARHAGTGSGIVGARVDVSVGGFVDSDHIFGLSEDSLGRTSITIYKSGIRRAGAPQNRLDGGWRISEMKQPGITAMTQQEAESWVGKTASFTDSLAVIGEYRCALPLYSSATMSGDEFQREYRVSPNYFGIEGLVQFTKVACHDQNTWPGSSLIHIPTGVVASWDGSFFILKKQ